MRVLIMGYDSMGSHLASALNREGHSVTLLDTSPGRADTLPEDLRANVVPSSGSLMEDLRTLGMTNVDIALALSDDDNENAMAAQIASHMFHVPDVICRISDPQREVFYRDLDLNVVSPTQLLVDNIQRVLQQRP